MSRRRTLRVLATNDFGGSVLPLGTSYGCLPGLDGLCATVEALGADEPSLWIDGGDFGGGMLGEAVGAVGAFAPSKLAPIDGGVLGNHELDHGVDGLRQHAPELGYPLLCANAEIGLPPTALLSAGHAAVGLIGITNRHLHLLVPGAPSPQWEGGEQVVTLAKQLRGDGADFVVVALHDGVDWIVHGDGRVEFRSTRIADELTKIAPAVDLVVGAHTIGRWIGFIGGVPFIQPWPFGAEVGIADLRTGEPAAISAVRPGPRRPTWDGPGGDRLAAAACARLGEFTRSWRSTPATCDYLPQLAAEALAEATGSAAAIVPAQVLVSQPPIDGVVAALPRGAVSEFDVWRLVRDAFDRCVIVELSADEVAAVVARLSEQAQPGATLDVPWTFLRMPPGAVATDPSDGTVIPDAWRPLITEWLERDLSGVPATTGIRGAIERLVRTRGRPCEERRW
jgi:hypothetical protein